MFRLYYYNNNDDNDNYDYDNCDDNDDYVSNDDDVKKRRRQRCWNIAPLCSEKERNEFSKKEFDEVSTDRKENL